MSGSDVIEPEMSFEDEEQTENNIRVEPETPCELNEISDMVLSEPDSQQKLSVSLDRNIWIAISLLQNLKKENKPNDIRLQKRKSGKKGQLRKTKSKML